MRAVNRATAPVWGRARLACWRTRPRGRELSYCDAPGENSRLGESLFRRDAETSTRDARAPRKSGLNSWK